MATATVTATTNATSSSALDSNVRILPNPPTQSMHLSTIEDPPASPAHRLRSSLSWKSIRSTISVSERTSAQLGWAVAFISVLLTIVTLSPAFKSQNLSEKAFKLAEWTALKDYIEECREELAAGIESQACLKAMNAKLPPPPYVRPDILDKARRRAVVRGRHQGNLTTIGAELEYLEFGFSNDVQAFLALALVLLGCFLLFFNFERWLSRNRRHLHKIFTQEQDSPTPTSAIQSPESHRSTTTSCIIRHPPSLSDATLRHRPIRNHPIYRHASLEEAIHEEDMSEIRTRLQNGDDVNQHWPYLIYRLAITPKAASTTNRLEIARLCLDFGADVNALKGWNGQSALMIAIHFGNVDVAKLLIVNGATVCYSPTDSKLTALHRCVRLAVTGSATDALEIMEMLFKFGADANQADRLCETALHRLLIEAWYQRDDDIEMKKLYPIALCLLDHGAHMPETIKEKYIIGNPLWDVVHTAIWETEWPEQVGLGTRLERGGRLRANQRTRIKDLRGEGDDGKGVMRERCMDAWR